MKTEAKVGAFTAVGLLLLVALVLGLSGFSLKAGKGYTVYAGFHQVIGVEKQAQVCLAGVPIGEVLDITNDGGGVTVEMRIHPDVRIPEGSHVTIGTPGVMGEKFVNIQPAEDRGHYIGDGAYLIGDDEQGMDTMFAGLNQVVAQAQELLDSLNSIAGDKNFRQSILQMTANMRDMTGHLSSLMAQLESMAAENRGNVQAMTANLVTVTASMNRTMASLEPMIANMNSVLGDPATAANVRETLENLKDTSERVQHVAATLDEVAGDPQTAADLKATIANARQISEKAGNMLGKVESIDMTPSADVLYSGSESDWSVNANLGVTMGDKTLDVGVDDIGDDSLFNAQVGKRFGSGHLGARGGVIAGEAGIGLDGYAGDKFKLSADAYDPDDVKLRLRATYDLGNGTALMSQWNDVTNKDDERAGYFGIRQSF
ncbi:MlaD family protein [Selenomonas sp.]|uniref:MlaD family protein n=1 Tax=Selenomonas sp. TaxID=2053611 RepID=UPI0025E7E96C|nr:MlaD family protein [Selenomonas sp.]MCI6282899.1 MlaD family protein [Selenomonas sp.]